MIMVEYNKDTIWDLKKYNCAAHCFDISAGRKIVVLNETEAHQNDIYTSYRVILKHKRKEMVVTVDLSSELVAPGQIGLFSDVWEELCAADGDMIEIKHTERPASIEYIKNKMDGKELHDEQIETVITELMDNKLSEAELSAFITSMYIRGLTEHEIVALTKSIVKSGDTLVLGKHPVVDKHCAGGVAGNRTTMVLVPILAASGLYVPKTSSRSITSAAGTADTMEVLCPVVLKLDEMKDIVLKTGGCIAWGGAMNLAAADDKLIRIRHPLSLDPRGVLLASILAKKKSVGAEYVVIDLPVGRGTKFQDIKVAQALGKDFIGIGKELGMKIEVLITDGSDPIGNGVGPGLECRDVFSVLEGKGPEDLRDKSCQLAGTALELCGKVEKGKGYKVAQELLKNGKALAKMREMIDAQGGNGKVKVDDLPLGKYNYKVLAPKSGRVSHVDNKAISRVAKAAGAPTDKGAGLFLFCEQGDKVERGEPLFEIYAESEAKLDFAIKALEVWEAVELQKVILGSME